MSKQSDGRIWPYAIVVSILLIVVASGMTIYVALNHPVELSDSNMQSYHHYDKNANEFIAAKIAFNRNYTITYVSEKFDVDNAVIVYKVTDTSGAVVNNAKVDIVLTRPDNRNSDLVLDNPTTIDFKNNSSPPGSKLPFPEISDMETFHENIIFIRISCC